MKLSTQHQYNVDLAWFKLKYPLIKIITLKSKQILVLTHRSPPL